MYKTLGFQHRGHKDVYVSLSGQDTETCGDFTEPCRTILRAIQLVDWDGHIYLNGTGTKEQPLDCKNPRIAHDQNPGISISKSVSMESFEVTSFIACEKGFHFNKLKRRIKIRLTGIAFKNTPVTFDDCSQVQFINCSHQNTQKAIIVVTKTVPTLHIDIQGSSFFQNNQQCVEILLKNGSGHFLVINIGKSRFQENGILDMDGQAPVKALISIATDVKTPSKSTHVQISCHNVTIVENRGPFLILDLASALTKEMYSHVKILNNNLTTPSDEENKRFSDGMYISRARKTDVRFANFVCANNSNNLALRCIKISSYEARVDIDDSSFVGHKVACGKGGAVFVDCKLHASLVIKHTAFEKNRASFGGGAVFLDTVKGNLRLNLTNVNFSNCESATDGSAVMVGKTHTLRAKPIAYALYAYLKNVRVKDCVSRNSSMCVMLRSGYVTLKEFHWTNARPDTAGAIYVGSTGGKTDVTISGSNFSRSHPNGSVFVGVDALKNLKGRVTVCNTSMSNNQESALAISPRYRITLVNVTFSFCKHGLQISKRWLSHDPTPLSPVNILIDNCTFKQNVYDVSLTVRDPRSVSFMIKNSIFTGRPKSQHVNAYAIRFFIPALNLKKLRGSRATVTLDRVIFDSRPASSFAHYFQGKKTLIIRRSIFRNCTSFRREQWKYGDSKSIYETASGAISILSATDKQWKLGCVYRNVYNDTHPRWRYDSHVTFEDTLFQENAGLNAGAVYVSNGNTTFRNCSFLNNFAVRNTGQVYSAYGTGRVEFKNCSFTSDRKSTITAGRKFGNVAFFYSESEGPVVFQNTSMFSAIAQRRLSSVLVVSNGGYVDIHQNTTIHCSGSQLSLQNATHFVYTEKRKSYCLVNVTVLKFTCRLCSPGYYSLQTGHSYGLTVNKSFLCQPCPLGANCIRNNLNIAAKENFWGYKIPGKHPESLKFVPCPKKYCQSPSLLSALSAYNSCYGNRTGFLCGKCAPGYTESLFSAECRSATQCSDYLLWIIMIVFSFGLAVYLLTKPPLLRFLSGEHILWSMKKKKNPTTEQDCQDSEQLDSGYLKIAFYYYQVADLLLGNSLEELIPKVPLINAVVFAFNFQVSAIYRGIDCPLPGLTAVTKEVLLSLMVFATMANVLFIYCAHFVINLARKKAGKPSGHHYMAVVLEILLLGYDRIAETSLVLMHCVNIGSERRLFIDGNTPCWQTWQYLLLGYVVVFVVPFIAVLYYGSSKLYKSSISACEFLAACVLPLPLFVYWLLKWIFMKRREEKEDEDDDEEEAVTRHNDNIEVMKVLHEPFRAPIGRDQGTLYWESILIGRRLILLTFHSFIPNAMLRFFFMAGACDFMAIHHIVKNPFRDAMANKVEAVSLITLAAIAKIGLIKATLLSSGVTPEGENNLYIEGMQWFELVAMVSVPAILFLLAVLAILSQIARLVVLLIKRIIDCVQTEDTIRTSLEDITEPLLYT